MTTSSSLDTPTRIRQLMAGVALSGLLCLFAGCSTSRLLPGSGAAYAECGCAECTRAAEAYAHQYRQQPPTVANDYPALPPNNAASSVQAVPPAPVPPESASNWATDDVGRRLALDSTARDECAELRQQTAALQAQLVELQSDVSRDAETRNVLNQSLASVNGKVGALSNELDYWKQEVQRIDAEAEQQHQDDLHSLESIAELISRLPHPSAAATSRTRR